MIPMKLDELREYKLNYYIDYYSKLKKGEACMHDRIQPTPELMVEYDLKHLNLEEMIESAKSNGWKREEYIHPTLGKIDLGE